jgi:large subunit ribosomal protein L19
MLNPANSMNLLEKIQRENLRTDLPDFKVGDTVRVHTKIKEGDKERIQIFEGAVIRRKGHGCEASFTVRKVSYGVGVERIFPIYSPMIDKVEIATRGKVRRARLYYLRKLSGKKARIEGEKGFQSQEEPEGQTKQ